MLSRVAENLYWLGRYLERAENIARMARADFQASLEGTRHPQGGSVWEGLLAATDTQEAFEAAQRIEPELRPVDFLLVAPVNGDSLRGTVEHARWLAQGLREHISREVWEEINALHLSLTGHRRVVEADLEELCTGIRHRIQTVFGLYDNAALRDEGREWFRSGLFIERADMTSRILDAKYHILLPDPSEVGGPLDRFQWMAILRSASAWEAFRKNGYDEVSGTAVADLLCFNRHFPRSLAFSVMALHRHVEQALSEAPPMRRAKALRPIMLLELDLDALDVEQVVAGGLHEFLDSFQGRLIEIDDTLTTDIFRFLRQPAAEAAQ